jgi:Trp operon repressor
MARAGGGAAKTHVSTDDMRSAISRRWKAPEYAIMWEVGDATGARHSRLADAVIMGLWPSRGIDLQGVEIKVYRSDWQRELKDPEKAEQIARFCDFWWIHAAPDVVREEELPQGWGLRVYDGRVWTTKVEAERRKAEPVSREFLAALLRRSDQQASKEAKRLADEMLADERAKIDQRVQQGIAERTRLSASLATVAEEFENATGLSLERLAKHGEARYAARITAALMKQDLHNPYMGLEWLVKQLRQTADAAAEAMQSIGLEPPAPEDCKRPVFRR